MLEWLKKKGEHARIKMCLKNVETLIKAESEPDKEKLLAIVALLVNDIKTDDYRVFEMLNNPFAYGRDELLSVYEQMETESNQNFMQISNFRKAQRKLGGELIRFIIPHSERTNLALQLLMITLACGINDKILDRVKNIWLSINFDFNKAQDGVFELRKFERQIVRVGNPPLFPEINEFDWTLLCSYRPDFLGIKNPFDEE